CLKWKSTSKFVQAKKTVDKLDFHRVCLQSETIIPFTGNDGFFIFYEVALLSLSTSENNILCTGLTFRVTNSSNPK
ncbi:hypothetical protein ACQKGD_25035, partial [Peribacillus frigoritolerans]|uniref:hypothetical protein n=1 Tax=Peribacillus frigoritolerans TaxID=450367 RepID=UPI003D07071B